MTIYQRMAPKVPAQGNNQYNLGVFCGFMEPIVAYEESIGMFSEEVFLEAFSKFSIEYDKASCSTM